MTGYYFPDWYYTEVQVIEMKREFGSMTDEEYTEAMEEIHRNLEIDREEYEFHNKER